MRDEYSKNFFLAFDEGMAYYVFNRKKIPQYLFF